MERKNSLRSRSSRISSNRVIHVFVFKRDGIIIKPASMQLSMRTVVQGGVEEEAKRMVMMHKVEDKPKSRL